MPAPAELPSDRATNPAGDLLLRICAAPEAKPSPSPRRLPAETRKELATLATATRTAPLLHRALEADDEAQVPGELAGLRDEARWQNQYALAQTLTLAKAHDRLAELDIRPLVLKGFGLAFRHYPQPSLRPLRDLDILVPTEKAVAARDHLLESGFLRVPGAGHYGVDHLHQLPEIWDKETGVTVEIHHRLCASGWSGDSALTAAIQRDTTDVPVLGRAISIPSDEANFLHLVQHAAIHHLFANGPLILSDLHYLARGGRIDWTSLERSARELSLERGLHLLMALASHHGARWVPDEIRDRLDVEDRFIREASEMLLLTKDEIRERDMLRRIADDPRRAGGKLAVLRRALSPDREELAKFADRPADSLLRWLGYPRWLLDRGVRYLRSRRQGNRSNIELRDWLAGGSGASVGSA